MQDFAGDFNEYSHGQEGENFVPLIAIMHVETAFDGGVGEDLFGGVEGELGDCIFVIVQNAFFEADFGIWMLCRDDVGSHYES